jgi:hypothetical protein
MAATVLGLLTESCYLSVNDRQFQREIEGDKLEVALELYQDILDEVRNLVPFYDQAEFTTLNDLSQTSFISVDSVAYLTNNTTISFLKSVNAVEWNKIVFQEGLTSVPAWYWFDELTQNLNIYPEPTGAFKLRVIGKISYLPAANAVEYSDALPANMPRFFQTFLKYKLAYALADYYSAPFPESRLQRLSNIETMIMANRKVNIKEKGMVEMTQPRDKGAFPWLAAISGNSP